MALTERLILVTPTSTTVLAGSTLNALANNALVLSAAFNNVAGQALDGALGAWLTLKYKFQVAPGANTGFSVWVLGALDPGANAAYEDGLGGGSPYTPDRAPDCVLGPVASGDTNAHQVRGYVQLPPGYCKFLIKNNGTGQTLTANDTDNVLTIAPEERQAS